MKAISLNNGSHYYLSDFNTIVNAEIKDHFLQYAENRQGKMEIKSLDKQELLDGVIRINQVSFEVTQNCDLDCKYCIFGSAYPNQRKNSGKTMEQETAFRGLNFLYNFLKNREKRELAISFYGGEPLLNFSLIRDIHTRSRELFKGWELSYFITSNLTVFNDEILRFLVDNDIHLNVSLDGPPENHDAKRVYHNGEGSFATVMANLKKIKDNDAEYFKKTSITAVYSADLPMAPVYEFFCEDERINGNAMRLNGVNRYDSDYYQRYPRDEKARREENKAMWDTIYEKKRRGVELSAIDRFMLTRFSSLDESLTVNAIPLMAHSCVFDSKLYIDAHGRFHACERINNKFSFGDVEIGFDGDKILEICQAFAEVNQSVCGKCDFRYLCPRCLATFAEKGVFKPSPDICHDLREATKENLNVYIKLKSEGII